MKLATAARGAMTLPAALALIGVVAVFAAVMVNEAQKTAWSSALRQANDADNRAQIAMQVRPDQKAAIMTAVDGLTRARRAPGTTWLRNYDAATVHKAIEALDRTIDAAKAAPRSPASPRAPIIAPPARSGCFDRNGPIPGCK